MKLNNYRIIFLLRILKSILQSFVDVFFVLYFLTVSNHHILPLGIYKIISMVTVWLVIFSFRNYSKKKERIHLMQIGILLYFFYFLFIVIWKEKIVDYMYILGILYGLEEGFYYSVYNIIETDAVDNQNRAKYIGVFTLIKNVISIFFPLLFGVFIQNCGFISAVFFSLFIVLIELLLSQFFHDGNIPKMKKTNFKAFYQEVKKDAKFQRILAMKFCGGLTYSEGALSYVITIYIIKVFSESLSLGIFTSVFCLISALIGFLFAKIIHPKYYRSLIISTSIVTIVLLCVMILHCNFFTIVLYHLFQTISKTLTDLVNEKNTSNFSNTEGIRKEFKIEYFLSIETALLMGRVISNSLFILMAFTNSDFIMAIFVGFAAMRAIFSIRL